MKISILELSYVLRDIAAAILPKENKWRLNIGYQSFLAVDSHGENPDMSSEDGLSNSAHTRTHTPSQQDCFIVQTFLGFGWCVDLKTILYTSGVVPSLLHKHFTFKYIEILGNTILKLNKTYLLVL